MSRPSIYKVGSNGSKKTLKDSVPVKGGTPQQAGVLDLGDEVASQQGPDDVPRYSAHWQAERLAARSGPVRFDRTKHDLRSMSREDIVALDLRGADLSGADLSHLDLSYKDLSGANLRGATLSGINLEGATMFGVDLSSAHFRDEDLRGSNQQGIVHTTALRWMTDEQLAQYSGQSRNNRSPATLKRVGTPTRRSGGNTGHRQGRLARLFHWFKRQF